MPKPTAAKTAADQPSAAPVGAVLQCLEALYPDAECELTYHNPLELLVAVILSAQCTDKRVNMVTPAFFARFKTARAIADAEPGEVENLLRSINFWRNKARNIQAACQIIAERHGGEVPREMHALLELPGVARKTANVVLGTGFGIATGVVVDTHVRRLTQRLGMTAQDDPEKIEKELCALWPRDKWIKTSHQLILHGRRVCLARGPRCHECGLAPLCPSFARV